MLNSLVNPDNSSDGIQTVRYQNYCNGDFMEEFWFAFVVTFVVGIVILILADIYNGY
jgi:hypothetical protein